MSVSLCSSWCYRAWLSDGRQGVKDKTSSTSKQKAPAKTSMFSALTKRLGVNTETGTSNSRSVTASPAPDVTKIEGDSVPKEVYQKLVSDIVGVEHRLIVLL